MTSAMATLAALMMLTIVISTTGTPMMAKIDKEFEVESVGESAVQRFRNRRATCANGL